MRFGMKQRAGFGHLARAGYKTTHDGEPVYEPVLEVEPADVTLLLEALRVYGDQLGGFRSEEVASAEQMISSLAEYQEAVSKRDS